MLTELLPKFLPQCCDAALYLYQGESCATDNNCYDQLRPIGAQLWFSLPFRLGLPADTLILVHWLLLALSVVFSAVALRALLQRATGTTGSHTVTLVLLLASTCIHVMLFWPVLPLALTDAPATLFILIAVWLLLTNPSARYCALAGLLLGAAAWLRFAWLYPLLGAQACFLVLWCFNRKRQRHQLLLLLALLPVAIQYGATWQRFHLLQYLGPKAYDDLSSEHALSVAAGQESILPQQQYLWPTGCAHAVGIDQALHEHDLASALCLMAARFRFAFGSYAPDTYVFAATNLLTHSAIEHVGLDSRWHHWTVEGIARTVLQTPVRDGQGNPFNEILVITPSTNGAHTVSAIRRVPAGKPYTFSIWLWSSHPDTIDLVLRSPVRAQELARTTVVMTHTPTRYAVTGSLPATASFFGDGYDDLEVTVGSTPSHDVTFDDKPSATFYAWGAQLEQAAAMSAYRGPDANDVDTSFRWWSNTYLAANILALLSVPVFAFRFRRQLDHCTALTVFVLMALALAEVLVTQPEQRFVIGIQVCSWFSALALSAVIVVRVHNAIPQLHRS